MHREDYCKPAILFEVLDGSVTFSYEKHKVTLNKRDLLVINKGTEYQYDASEDIILASLELMGSTFESVCDGVKQSVICNSVNGDNERYDALRAILRQLILNQAYVADNEEEYSYLVFDYYSQYYKLLETIVSFFLSDKAGSRRPDGKSGNAERMAQIERYLNVHFADAVSLDRMSWSPLPWWYRKDMRLIPISRLAACALLFPYILTPAIRMTSCWLTRLCTAGSTSWTFTAAATTALMPKKRGNARAMPPLWSRRTRRSWQAAV